MRVSKPTSAAASVDRRPPTPRVTWISGTPARCCLRHAPAYDAGAARRPMQKPLDELERTIRERCDAGDHDGAATAALRGYGPHVYALLVSIHRDEAAAGDVFATFSEQL